jgi:hypothetical protein
MAWVMRADGQASECWHGCQSALNCACPRAEISGASSSGRPKSAHDVCAGFLLGSRETLLETKDGGRTWAPRSVAAAQDEGARRMPPRLAHACMRSCCASPAACPCLAHACAALCASNLLSMCSLERAANAIRLVAVKMQPSQGWQPTWQHSCWWRSSLLAVTRGLEGCDRKCLGYAPSGGWHGDAVAVSSFWAALHKCEASGAVHARACMTGPALQG